MSSSSNPHPDPDKVIPFQKPVESTPTEEQKNEALDQAFAEKARATAPKPPLSRTDINSLRQIVYRNYPTLEALMQDKHLNYSDLADLLKEHYKLQKCKSESVRKYMSDARKTTTAPPSSPTTKRPQETTKPDGDQSPHSVARRDPRKNNTSSSQSANRQEFNL